MIYLNKILYIKRFLSCDIKISLSLKFIKSLNTNYLVKSNLISSYIEFLYPISFYLVTILNDSFLNILAIYNVIE